MRQSLDLPDPFEVRLWVDPVTELSGVDVHGPYPEAYWLPHLGPSALLVGRRLAAQPGTWDKALLARAIGLGNRSSRPGEEFSAPSWPRMEAALARLVAFRLAHDADGVLHVCRYWPRLPGNLLAKLPPELRSGEAELAAA